MTLDDKTAQKCSLLLFPSPNLVCTKLTFSSLFCSCCEHPVYKVIGGKHTIVSSCEEVFWCLKKQNNMADALKVNNSGLHIWVNERSWEEVRCLQPLQRQHFAVAGSVGAGTCLVLNDLYSDQPLHCTMHVSAFCGHGVECVRCCFSSYT